MDRMQYHPSFIEYFGEQEGHRCGYCNSSDTSCSHGFWAHSLRVEDYQDLIDRGWRRSGQYCYKPIMNTTCCPMYTIRCAAKEFKLSKSQKRILKKFNNFLATDNIKSDVKDVKFRKTEIGQSMEIADLGKLSAKVKGDTSKMISSSVDSSVTVCDEEDEKVHQSSEITNCDVTMKPVDSSVVDKKIKPEKAKQMRIARKREKLKALGLTDVEIEKKMREKKKMPVIKSVEDFIDAPLPEKSAHQLEVRLVRSSPPSDEFEDTYDASFELYKTYQMFVHKDPPEKLTHRQYQRFLCKSPLKIKLVLVKSEEFNASVNESAALFSKYQKIIHNEDDEDCDFDSFYNFLVDSPLEAKKGYGSYHQQYWLDKKLIAVGVIDILPRCLSSVYFFYDPDYANLSLGTYGALREVAFTRSLTSRYPELLFYYMGFYIHTCPKMRYKAALMPSYLLCPEVYTWHPVQSCLPKLDASKYSRFNEDSTAEDQNSKITLSEVSVYYNGIIMPYDSYSVARKLNSREIEEITEYATLVGMICAKRMVLYRPPTR